MSRENYNFKASIGSILIAFLAGKKPDSTPRIIKNIMVVINTLREIIGFPSQTGKFMQFSRKITK